MRLGINKSDAEDISQEVLLRCVEKGWRQPVQFAVIDIIRKKFGRAGERRVTEVDISKGLDQLIVKQSADRIEFEKALVGLEKSERVMVILRCVWGFGLEEIAYCFDMSATGVMEKMDNCF